MPYRFELDETPLGYVANPGKAGERVTFSIRGFLSSEDGDTFVKYLEGFPDEYLKRLPADKRILPSMVDNLLAIVRADKSVILYVNELKMVSHIKPKRAIKKGELVSDKDIADIADLNIRDVDIPKDAGILFIISRGWRKALFYDFEPINPKRPNPREYDLDLLLGQIMGYLVFQHLFRLTDNDWRNLFDQEWFPFVTLNPMTIKKMIGCAKNNWPIDDMLSEICSEVETLAKQMVEKWRGNPFFADHLAVLEMGIKLFLDHNYIGSISTLFPRIEGVLRTHHLSIAPDKGMKQEALSESAVSSIPAERRSTSLLLPSKFQEYLETIYFKTFDPANPQGVSRNTVGHGVTPQAEFDVKGAVLAILILDQLAYSFI